MEAECSHSESSGSSMGSGGPDRTPHFRPEDFRGHTVIGKGKDSVIYSAWCDRLGEAQVAIKVYAKPKLSASKLRAIKREAAMMIYMTRKRVPLVTAFHGAFQDSRHIYIVMEYCSGGDLLELLLREGRAMAEARVAVEVAQPLLGSLAAMHALRIVHRDIKLENVFLDGEGRVRVGDFGLTMSMKQELAISPVGTVEYMAPEVVSLPAVDLVTSGQVQARDIKPCNEKVDIWALGVTLYELLTGHLPFEGRDKPAIKQAIAEGRTRPLPASLSLACASFVTAMLTQDPAQRPSAEQLLQHAYLQAHCKLRPAAELVAGRELRPGRSALDRVALAQGSPSSSFTSQEARLQLRHVTQSQGSATSQLSLPSLPPSFTLRHNEIADSTLPETTIVRMDCSARDSTDSLVRARHAALLECGSSTSSGSSMTMPSGGTFDASATARASPQLPLTSRSTRRKRNSPLQVETRSASAGEPRGPVLTRLHPVASANVFRKVGLYFKSMLGREGSNESASSDQLGSGSGGPA